MKYCLLFCLTLLSLKLLVNGRQYKKARTNYTTAVSLDLCELVGDTGPCNNFLRRYYYSLEEKRCLMFLYGGCEGNNNNFKSALLCADICPGKIVHTRTPLDCFHEPETGPCNDIEKSFYYDRKENDCVQFVYGGCKGNNNRFSSYEKCLSTCKVFEIILEFKP